MAPLASAMALKSVQRYENDTLIAGKAVSYGQNNKYFNLATKPLPMSPVLESLHKYNEKLMNSIWGLYNMNAPPAFQKNTEIDSRAPRIVTQSSSASLGLFGHH